MEFLSPLGDVVYIKYTPNKPSAELSVVTN